MSLVSPSGVRRPLLVQFVLADFSLLRPLFVCRGLLSALLRALLVASRCRASCHLSFKRAFFCLLVDVVALQSWCCVQQQRVATI
jgi:hypothetical protein